MMALPGELRCRPVATCGAPPWGDVPLGRVTQFVDGSYAGADSDGSEAKPWTAIQAAVDAATAGGVVAIADGDYPEALIVDKAVEIIGRCPDAVSIGPEGAQAAILFGEGADGAALRAVSVRAALRGVQVEGASDVTIDRVRVHDTAGAGLVLLPGARMTGARLVGALLERNERIAAVAFASRLDIEDTVVRDVAPRPDDQTLGWGVAAQAEGGSPATLTVTRSIVERCYEEGIRVTGAAATLDGVLVRDVAPSAADDLFGRGVNSFVVEGVAPQLTVRGSVIERTLEAGINVAGGELTVEQSVVRDTREEALGKTGYGVVVHPDEEGSLPAGAVTLRSSVVSGTEGVGILMIAPAATIESVIVRGGRPGSAGDGGRGINVQFGAHTPSSTAVLRGVLLEDNAEIGLVVISAQATVESAMVRRTSPNALGRFGDGVAVLSQDGPAMATLSRLHIEASQRAGVSSFGAEVHLSSTTLECNAIDLDGETAFGKPHGLTNDGGNRCGCQGQEWACKTSSTNLEAPPPLPSGP